MAYARTDGSMSWLQVCRAIFDPSPPKFPLQPQKYALRFFIGKYLQKLDGDFASPRFAEVGVAHG